LIQKGLLATEKGGGGTKKEKVKHKGKQRKAKERKATLISNSTGKSVWPSDW